VDEIRTLVKNQQSDFHNLRDAFRDTDVMVQALQDGSRSQGDLLEATRKELERTNQHVTTVHDGLDNANESIVALRECQRVTRSEAQRLDQEARTVQHSHAALLETVEQQVMLDVATLQQSVAQVLLDVNRLHLRSAQTCDDLAEAKSEIRGHNAETQSQRGDLLKTNTVVHILEQRILDASQGLQQTKQNVDELQAVSREANETLSKTRTTLGDLSDTVRKVGKQVKSTQEGLDSATRNLGSTTTKLDGVVNTLDTTRQNLDTLRQHVQCLKDGHLRAQKALTSLQGEVSDVGATTSAVQTQLRQTNAMVLPNLNAENEVTKDHPFGASTPRRSDAGLIKKVSSQRNYNSMSWI